MQSVCLPLFYFITHATSTRPLSLTLSLSLSPTGAINRGSSFSVLAVKEKKKSSSKDKEKDEKKDKDKESKEKKSSIKSSKSKDENVPSSKSASRKDSESGKERSVASEERSSALPGSQGEPLEKEVLRRVSTARTSNFSIYFFSFLFL